MKLFGNKIHLPQVRFAVPTELRLNTALVMAAAIIAVPLFVGCFKLGAYFAERDLVETRTATVQQYSGADALLPPAEPQLTDTELLAIGIYVVSGDMSSKSDYTLTMVGNVIKNRVNAGDYPGTYEEVLEQPSQFGALSYTGAVWPTGATAADKDRAMGIAAKVMVGEQLLPRDAVYVSNTQQGQVVAMLDGLYFCR